LAQALTPSWPELFATPSGTRSPPRPQASTVRPSSSVTMQAFPRALLQQADSHPAVACYLLTDDQLKVLGTAPNGVEVQSTGHRIDDYVQVLLPVYVKERNLQFASSAQPAASIVTGNVSASMGHSSSQSGYPQAAQLVSQTPHQGGFAGSVFEVSAPMPLAAENDDLDDIVERNKTDGKVTFFFVKVDFIHSFQPSDSCKSMPCFQELRRQGALEEVCLSKNEALQGKLIDLNASVVSHRWETPKVPDPDGEQLREISKYLSDKSLVKLMWKDYWCIPQGHRTRAENKYFRWVMEHMDFLYLGCPDVLALIDMSSQSRFWTQFEAWMAMQACSSDGLKPAAEHSRRCQIRCIHSAEQGKDDKKMTELWAQRKPAEAHELLKARDVAVTNQTDKDLWLPLIFELDVAVKSAFTLSHAEDLRAKGEMVATLFKAGFSGTQLKDTGCTLALQLKGANYTATQLKDRGFTSRELREAGFTSRELREAGFTSRELREAGFTIRELREAGCTIRELRVAGFTIRELHEAGFAFFELRDAGLTWAQMREAGFTGDTMREIDEAEEWEDVANTI